MNKQLIENYMREVWNNKNLDIIQKIFSDDALIHSPLGQFKTPGEMAETVKRWMTAIPDLQVELLHTIEDGELVVSHWKARGTHKRDLNNITAIGNPVEYHGVTMYRIKNRKVTEYWAYLDSWTLEQQMKGEI